MIRSVNVSKINDMAQTTEINGKKYYRTVANVSMNANRKNSFIKGKEYLVRSVEEIDGVNPDVYCIIRGTFDRPIFKDDDFYIRKKTYQTNSSSYIVDLTVRKDIAKEVLSYVI